MVIRHLARVFLADGPPAATARFLADLADAAQKPDYMPMQITEVAPTGLVPRAGLANADRSVTILWRGESIDLECAIATQPLVDFCKLALSVLPSVMRKYGRKGVRLALVREELPELASPSPSGTAQRLLAASLLAGGQEPFEWDVRVARTEDRAFGQHRESTNSIMSVHRGVVVRVNSTEPEDRIRYSTDVNTLPAQKEPRFSDADAADFFEKSADWHSSLEGAILQHIRP